MFCKAHHSPRLPDATFAVQLLFELKYNFNYNFNNYWTAGIQLWILTLPLSLPKATPLIPLFTVSHQSQHTCLILIHWHRSAAAGNSNPNITETYDSKY